MPWRRKIFATLFLPAAMVLQSCQTSPPTSPVPLPGRILSSFGRCWRQSGSINFTLFRRQNPVVSASADWVHDPDGAWRWELYDLLGRTFLSGELSHGKMSAEGQMADEFERVSIDSDGFISYAGDPLALKWKELNCLLTFHLPEEWTDLVQAAWVNSKDGSDLVDFIDQDRSMVVKFDKEKVCGLLYSRFMFFFRRERVGWCFFKEPQRAYLNFENIFRIEWTNAEEKEQEWTDYWK